MISSITSLVSTNSFYYRLIDCCALGNIGMVEKFNKEAIMLLQELTYCSFALNVVTQFHNLRQDTAVSTENSHL